MSAKRAEQIDKFTGPNTRRDLKRRVRRSRRRAERQNPDTNTRNRFIKGWET
jgi:hypothetical protein